MRSEWSLELAWKAKRQGHVWIVKNKAGERGYFKFTTTEHWYFSGPMIANEWIAAKLATYVGLPTARLEEAVVIGPNGQKQKGIVSLEVKAQEITTWYDASPAIRQYPEDHVKHLDLLRMLVVFDAWIVNVD